MSKKLCLLSIRERKGEKATNLKSLYYYLASLHCFVPKPSTKFLLVHVTMVCKSWPSKLLKEIYPRTHFHTLICNAFHTFSLLAVTTICSNSYFMTPYPKSSAEFFSHKNLFTIPFKRFFQRYPYLLFILQNSFFWGSSRELVSTVEER